MKVVFMGTPAFAAESLAALLEAGRQVVAVVTRPDARSGRGLRVRPSPTAALAGARGIPVLRPSTVRDAAFVDRIRSFSADLLVVVAFGRLLPGTVLRAAPLGAVNVHASLLPALRGAAPIAWAIATGATRTGVTTMRINERLDAGDILLQRDTPIGERETAGELHDRLARMGGDLLVETLAALERGAIAPRPQDEGQATYAPLLKKSDGIVDWRRTAVEIDRRVRAFDPWPGATTRTPGGAILRLWKASPAGPAAGAGDAGEVIGTSRERDAPGLLVRAGGGSCLRLEEVQPEGGRRMGALEALSGRYVRIGDRLG